MREDIDWNAVTPEVIDFVLSQAEKHLQTQIETSLAADQRALTAASILTTLGSAVLAAVIAYWAADKNGPILAAGLTSGLTAIVGALCCLYAARPVNFYFPGATPDAWQDCLHEPLKNSKGVEIENYQARIDANETVLAGNAHALWWGACLGAGSPILGVALWVIISLFSQG